MSKMRVAVVGGGVSGLVAAYVAAEAESEVVLYEKEDYLGGHAKTVTADGTHLDLGFMVFNRVTYPNMMEFFESLGVDMELSDMSFSVSLDKGKGCEWGSRNGFSGVFAQKRNVLNPYFWKMIREIIKFKDDVLSYLEELDNNPDIDRHETLGHFVQSRGYSELFLKAYLIPICGSIWSCSSEGVMSFSAYSILSFCRNHHLLQLFGRPQWLTVRWRSQDYVNRVREVLERRGCQIRTNSDVCSVSSNDEGCSIRCKDGSEETYDGCIIAAHAPDALKMLGNQATFDESRILGAFQYAYSDIYLHRDKNLMPKNPAAWSAWNFLGSVNNKVCVTYWLNTLQNISQTGLPFLVTLNPPSAPAHTLLKWSTGHPIPSVAASKASSQLHLIQGKRRIWFCGAYQGYGFHEDGLKGGILAANGLLRKSCTLLNNPKHMVPSWLETGARLLVTKFLERFIATGCLILLENGGTMFTFEGTTKKCFLKVYLRIHNPQFYWKVATEADLGLADAYINGDFSFVDKNEGLLNLFMIFTANRDLSTSTSKLNHKRGWWTPLLFTSAIASAKYFYQHMSRQNTLTQARRNISRHYDLSNELFSLFLDETMTYSCAIFKTQGEDLKIAQLRKISLLIEKAQISKNHHILEIGCGWGTLAIEVVKITGCKYTGITLSEQQLQYAELKVKEAGLQDHIKFLLCDYRRLPKKDKYDRIISCEMLEAVGHEYIEEFFRCCESVLAEDGLLVLQFISIPDVRYDEYRHSSDFIREYIFPGGCLPSLSRVTAAMAAASRLCVEHLEDIGIHYHETLRCWRENFLKKQSEIQALGFNEKFIRTWEYYFDYCAAGFKTCTLGNYQIVFSRPGNVAAFGDPYKVVPSA
ncbi:Cyclopropane-fatty-acyl-phospholipid synthase [Handroanthus impetiginosus]|uniref:Cyclopropane-fatty-acyl-phospholipid synthase n=1 Tax=Handroanthus impetiginosus TaxID=429701 RepID=A0A2G9HK74_9LAMI|nr:Cyclopropane-fatty-acyl-phospholipid synthase [Handroanthus impetiginosus]